VTDTRNDPPGAGTERELLQTFLQYQRDTVVMKLEGLTLEEATRRLVPSDTTILGMVKHLGWVELSWFLKVLNGTQLDVPWTKEDPDADFRIEPGETVESVVAFYRDACRQADEAAAEHALDDLATNAREPRSLRWIYIHMIEETARHVGQADILREQTDGATGE
jgi:hypothetical protein